MKKFLLLLLGIILIFLLSLICFENKVDVITQDLINRTNQKLNKNNIYGIDVSIVGEGYKTKLFTRVSGNVFSEEERKKVLKVARSVEGVFGVEDNLTIKKAQIVTKKLVFEEVPLEINSTKNLEKNISTKLKKEQDKLKKSLDLNDTTVLPSAVVVEKPKDLASAVHIVKKEDSLNILEDEPFFDVDFLNKDNADIKKQKKSLNKNESVKQRDENISTSKEKDKPEDDLNVLAKEISKEENQTKIEKNLKELEKISNVDLNDEKEIKNVVNECQGYIDGILKQNKINFESNSAKIEQESKKILKNLAFVIKTCKKYIKKVHIEGHTDSSGNKKLNKELSQKRADAVKEYLIKKEGVDPKILEAVGFGDTKPIASNKTDEGKSKNRRIEFKIEGVL